MVKYFKLEKKGGLSMEEKILAKLDAMEKRFDSMEKKIDGMDNKFDELKNELREEFKQENAKLKEELRSEFQQENQKLEKRLEERLIERMKQEVLDQMFAFEAEYGRNINIMFEEIMARNEKRNALEKNFNSLERRVNKNSAFIFSHENRITTLEKAKK